MASIEEDSHDYSSDSEKKFLFCFCLRHISSKVTWHDKTCPNNLCQHAQNGISVSCQIRVRLKFPHFLQENVIPFQFWKYLIEKFYDERKFEIVKSVKYENSMKNEKNTIIIIKDKWIIQNIFLLLGIFLVMKWHTVRYFQAVLFIFDGSLEWSIIVIIVISLSRLNYNYNSKALLWSTFLNTNYSFQS